MDDNESLTFSGDICARKALAVDWTSQFLSDDQNTVIGIDAEWGTGKTFLAMNWYKMLKNDEYATCYIDAFKYDFTNDPFLIIVSCIIEQIKENDPLSEKIKQKASLFIKSMKSLACTGVKVASNIIPGVRKAIDDVSDGVENFKNIDDISIDGYKKFKDYAENLNAFKQVLEELCKQSKKPMIIFVDELDRCKPSFAIELLEKIKYIFDTPKLKFLLFINFNELSNAVCGVYGSKVNGYAYLDKFIKIILKLKSCRHLSETEYEGFISNYIQEQKSEYLVKQSKNIIFYGLQQTLCMYDLSFRDTQRIIILLNNLQINNGYILEMIMVLKAIQLKDRQRFQELSEAILVDGEFLYQPDTLGAVYLYTLLHLAKKLKTIPHRSKNNTVIFAIKCLEKIPEIKHTTAKKFYHFLINRITM